jgi:hypothetical protein
MVAQESRQLDLAATLPQTAPWPPIFVGEPATTDMKQLLARGLNSNDVNNLARWGRAFAYYATAMLNRSPHSVPAVARERIHGLLSTSLHGFRLDSLALPGPHPPVASVCSPGPARV